MENMKLSDRFITAMFLPKEYDKLLKLKISKVISYIICLILLVTLIDFAVPNLGTLAGMGGIRNYILNDIPDFSLKDGVFQYGEKLEKKDEEIQTYYLIDTEKDKFTKEDLPNDMMQAVLVSKSNMLVFNGLVGTGMISEAQFSELKNLDLDNQSLANMSPFFYIMFAFIYVVYYMLTLSKYLFYALIYAVFEYFFIRVIIPELKFGHVFKTALFAQSVGLILEAVAHAVGSALFIMTGGIFKMVVTVALMNRAFMYIKMRQDGVKLR